MSLDVGSRCSFPCCGTIDFLPILCRCNKHYCRYHAVPESHSCPALSEKQSLACLGDAVPCCVPGCKRSCATASTQVDQARTTYRFAEPYCIVWVVHHLIHTTLTANEQQPQTILITKAFFKSSTNDFKQYWECSCPFGQTLPWRRSVA